MSGLFGKTRDKDITKQQLLITIFFILIVAVRTGSRHLATVSAGEVQPPYSGAWSSHSVAWGSLGKSSGLSCS